MFIFCVSFLRNEKASVIEGVQKGVDAFACSKNIETSIK